MSNVRSRAVDAMARGATPEGAHHVEPLREHVCQLADGREAHVANERA